MKNRENPLSHIGKHIPINVILPAIFNQRLNEIFLKN